MIGINEKLKKLKDQGKTINVAIAGIGQMGSSLISQMQKMGAFKLSCVANKNLNKSFNKLKDLGFKENDFHVISMEDKKISLDARGSYNCKPIMDELNRAAASGKVIFTDSLSVLTSVEEVDVVIDATGSPEAGAETAMAAINNKKHVVTLNVEADVVIGPILKRFAENAGVVYTVAAGDEPAAIKELFDLANTLNFEIVAAGKGKNNPLDRSANPSTLKEYSDLKGASTKMMTSFVDGTKSMEEMTCLSNATGLIPDCRGMHAAKADIQDLTSVFIPKKDGGILDKKGIVDFAIGNVAPGVFLIYTTGQEILKKELKYLLYGDGPYYLLYRPFHLASMEVPISVAKAYFYNETTISPMNGPVSEVATVAKKDLKPGDILDGIGGYMVYGLIEQYFIAKNENLVPLGLCENATVKRAVKKDSLLTYDDVELKADSVIYKLRKLQESLIY